MHAYEPQPITQNLKEQIQSITVIAPVDGMVTGQKGVPITLQPNDVHSAIHFRGFLLSSMSSVEYQMVAIMSLDKTGGYGQAFGQEFIAQATGTFGDKKDAFKSWMRHNKLKLSVDRKKMHKDLELMNKVRNAVAHFPITGMRSGNRPENLTFFIYNGSEHFIFDHDYWNSISMGYQRLNEAFGQIKGKIGHPIKTIDLSSL